MQFREILHQRKFPAIRYLKCANSVILNASGGNVDNEKIIDAVSTNGCVCPGDKLSYECTVMGGGLTIWTGSAFSCSSFRNEIVLRHSSFGGTGTYWMCNNGAIEARSLSVEGNNYTSQLNVTVTPDTAGTTINCSHDNFTHKILIFTSIIPTITG
jgi:hypothetical protein